MPLPKRLLDGYANFREGRYLSEAERYRKLGEGSRSPPQQNLVLLKDSNHLRNLWNS